MAGLQRQLSQLERRIRQQSSGYRANLRGRLIRRKIRQLTSPGYQGNAQEIVTLMQC
ncbi:MAG: hypothetical protein ACM37W_17420 [Actinomycetota bacterium]